MPAYFNDAERTATITAGQLAGFNVLQIINEPTAAALAFGLDKLEETQTVFVFDLGGGTFDVTIMRIEGHKLKIIATNGDHRLGGKDWDDIVVNFVAEEFDRVHGENPLLDLQSFQDLQTRSVSAKIQLSTRPQATIVHQYHGQSVKVDLTREEFERRSRHLIEKCKIICEMTLQDAKLKWSGYFKDSAGRWNDPHADGAGDDFKPLECAGGYRLKSRRSRGSRRGDSSDAVDVDRGRRLGRKTSRRYTRQQFSSREGGLIQVNDVTSHTLGVVLWDEANLEEYVFPMIGKTNSHSGHGEESVWDGERQYGKGSGEDC